jgi:nicotinamide-nucleotide amidase
MAAMWRDGVLPRLIERGLGQERVTRVYRLTGIGESAVAAALGEPLLRGTNPIVATYARADAVDVRISAVAEGGREPAELVAEAAEAVLRVVGDHVWGHDDDTWPLAISREMAPLGWSVALVEMGTAGNSARLLGDAPWLRSARMLSTTTESSLARIAEAERLDSGADVGLAVRALENNEDTTVELAAVGPFGKAEASQVAFLGGSEGQRRAGILAAALLFRIARDAAREKG